MLINHKGTNQLGGKEVVSVHAFQVFTEGLKAGQIPTSDIQGYNWHLVFEIKDRDEI